MHGLPIIFITALLAFTFSQCKSPNSKPATDNDATVKNNGTDDDLSVLDKIIPKNKSTVFANCEFRHGEQLIVSDRNRKNTAKEITIPINWKLGSAVVWKETPSSATKTYKNAVSTMTLDNGATSVSIEFAESKPATPRILNLYTLNLVIDQHNHLTSANAFFSSAKSRDNAALGKIEKNHSIDCGR